MCVWGGGAGRHSKGQTEALRGRGERRDCVSRLRHLHSGVVLDFLRCSEEPRRECLPRNLCSVMFPALFTGKTQRCHNSVFKLLFFATRTSNLEDLFSTRHKLTRAGRLPGSARQRLDSSEPCNHVENSLFVSHLIRFTDGRRSGKTLRSV